MKIELKEQDGKIILTDEMNNQGFVTLVIESDGATVELDILIQDLYTAVKAFEDDYIRSLKRDKLLE